MNAANAPRTVDIVDAVSSGWQSGGGDTRFLPENDSAVVTAERIASLHPDPASGTVEFGVGTGRIALPLSRHVGSVIGVDSSREMLDVLYAALDCDTPVTPVQADICSYTADRTVGLVYCVGTLSLLLTPESQQQAVQRAAELLAPGGRFIVETCNKPGVLATHAGRGSATSFTPHPEHGTGPQVRSVLLSDSGLWCCSRIWCEADGTICASTEISRPTTPDELDAYARAAGLEPESRAASWYGNDAPYVEQSPVFISTFRKSTA